MLVLRTRRMLLALALSACVFALGDAERSLGADPATTAQVGKTADGRPLYVWEPSQSWPGRPQFDPRLAERVTFWSTGIPLSDVFAAVHEQTGVEIGFFPADDQNRRVCVNLYLNPEAPPSLRELMVQLGWVTDCAFAWASDGETMSYHLLSTSLGSAAEQKIEDERYAAFVANESGQSEYAQHKAQLREELLARLPDLRKALRLTREEAIEEYQGKDDLLLLAVLDPGRRMIAQLATSLSPDQLEMVKRQRIGPRLSRWTPEQQGRIRDALGLALPGWLADRERLALEPNGEWGDWAWVERTDPDVYLSTWDSTGFRLSLEHPPDLRSPSPIHVFGSEGPRLGFLQLLVDPWGAPLIEPASQVDLRRLLGEEIGAEEVSRIYREYYSSLDRPERKRYLEAVLADASVLSARVSALLSSIALPIQPSKSYMLWQIQEAAAAHSGLHVISDCFHQPHHSIAQDFSALYPDGEVEPTAEMVLQLSCCPHYRHLGSLPGVGEKGWEWGDAGSFLRFRSRERDTWRAALLPPHVCEALDEWLQPYLPQSLPDDGGLPEIRVPLDLSQGIWLVSELASLQRAWGGKLIYCDPSDVENAYRHEYRAKMLRLAWSLGAIYRILGELTEDQWKRVRGDGLVWGVDFSPAVAAEDRSWGFWLDRKQGDVLRLADVESHVLSRLHGGPVRIIASAGLVTAPTEQSHDKIHACIVLRGEKVIAGDALPDHVTVRTWLTSSLVERR